MRWFRNTIRQGTWLALIALAINLGLSFGHVHAIEGNASEHATAARAASIGSPDDGQKGHGHNGRADYLCPICMAAGAMANALASAPPALPLQRVNVVTDRRVEDAFALVESSRGAFQPRAPPIS